MQNIQSLLAAALLAVSIGASADPLGFVKTVRGEASIVSGGQTTSAQPGSPIQLGDVLRTGPEGSMGITLRDNTMLSFGPSTSFTLEAFQFAPTRGELLLGGAITAGTLEYVSGAIAKLRPQAVKIRTPSGVIGVRGTRFVAVVPQ